MKICFLGDAITNHLRRWAKYFVQLGYQVDIITFNRKMLDGYEPIKVHLVEKNCSYPGFIGKLLSSPGLLSKTKKIIKTIKPDLIHCHDAGSYSWIGSFLGFHPLIISTWGSDILVHAKNSKFVRFLTKRALNIADLVHCDGYQMREEIINLKVNPEKIALVPFGTDIKKFVTSNNPEQIKAELGLSGKVVISTRILTPIHNVETVIYAAQRVLEKIKDVTFVIVAHGEEKERLMLLSEELGIKNNVKFLGRVEESQMVKLLQASDVYVSTSLSESGLAASTAEAMACQLPVINTNTGDIDQWIDNGNGGFIIPVKSPDSLAEKILCLLNNPFQFIEFGKRNREVIVEKNNYYKEMDKINQIYQRMIDEKSC